MGMTRMDCEAAGHRCGTEETLWLQDAVAVVAVSVAANDATGVCHATGTVGVSCTTSLRPGSWLLRTDGSGGASGLVACLLSLTEVSCGDALIDATADSSLGTSGRGASCDSCVCMSAAGLIDTADGCSWSEARCWRAMRPESHLAARQHHRRTLNEGLRASYRRILDLASLIICLRLPVSVCQGRQVDVLQARPPYGVLPRWHRRRGDFCSGNEMPRFAAVSRKALRQNYCSSRPAHAPAACPAGAWDDSRTAEVRCAAEIRCGDS